MNNPGYDDHELREQETVENGDPQNGLTKQPLPPIGDANNSQEYESNTQDNASDNMDYSKGNFSDLNTPQKSYGSLDKAEFVPAESKGKRDQGDVEADEIQNYDEETPLKYIVWITSRPKTWFGK